MDAHTSEDEPVRLVGGTFMFKSSSSTAQLQTLTRTLRLSIFVYLSLLLEQSLLADSHVELRFPNLSAGPMIYTQSSPPTTPGKDLKRHSFQKSSPSGIWSFLSKKTGNFLHRATHGVQSPLEFKRSGSLDLARISTSFTSTRSSVDRAQFHQSSRRLSFSISPGLTKPSRDNTIKATKQAEKGLLFGSVASRVSESASLLSTSAGMTFPVPQLIVKLEEKEKRDPNRKLTGEEKVGLTSILGWDGREVQGQNMSGLAGFVRHQGINALYVELIRSQKPPPSPAPSTDSEASSSGEKSLPQSHLDQTACLVGRWVTYRYYSRGRQNGSNVDDRTLGDTIEVLCEEAQEVCTQPGCEVKQCDHKRIWMHDEIRVKLSLSKDPHPNDPIESNTIRMWESCSVCHRTTPPIDMSDGT